MDRSLALLLTVAAGGLIALQAPINGRFGRTIGSLPAASVSFALGLAVLLAIVTVRGEIGRLGEAAHVPWWYLTGGILGAAYVTTVLITIGTLGAGPVVAATIAAQLTVSLLVDQFGWLGVARDPITASQVAGVVLLGLGVYLIVRS
ncbi:MAG: DMT family transporter [Solirubrobacterales bacterium]|nr:DMT family transporter [Solirubrobacterales bacterium]